MHFELSGSDTFLFDEGCHSVATKAMRVNLSLACIFDRGTYILRTNDQNK